MQLSFIGDRLVVLEGDLGPRILPSSEFEKDGVVPGSVEEAALHGAWIVRHGPPSNDNREIGYEVMRQMLEAAGHPWPRPDEDAAAIEKMLIALEAGTISEAEFVDWVCLRVATA